MFPEVYIFAKDMTLILEDQQQKQLQTVQSGQNAEGKYMSAE